MFRRLSIGAVALVTGVNLTVPLHAQTAAPTVGQQRPEPSADKRDGEET